MESQEKQKYKKGNAAIVEFFKVGRFDKPEFHENWDWLMQVVEKIESCVTNTSCVVRIEDNSCMIFYRGVSVVRKIDRPSKHEAVWQACIDFIKWKSK